MPSSHRHPPISVRPPELLRNWLMEYASRTGRSVRSVITEALEEYRARREEEGLPGMRIMTTEVARDSLHRAFVWNFMRPDQTAQTPIYFPGLTYSADGTLTEDAKGMATQHLITVLHDNGCVIRADQGVDPARALHHVLWDKWTQDEIGTGRFIGRLFDDHGRIYLGCTATDAAAYTAERLASLGGRLYSYTVQEDGPQ